MSSRLRVGISECLLGRNVRWDGGHKRDEALVAAFGDRVEWVPVCPEVEAGMGVPREPIRLVGDPAEPRVVGERSGVDHTAAMTRWAEAKVAELARLDLAGFVLKSSSPSCGKAEVRVWPEDGAPPRLAGVGLFARALLERLPELPVEEESRLQDPAAREAFVARVLAYAGRRGRSA